MRINKAVAYSATTHEGGRADAHQSSLIELERTVSTCLLWEDTFYEKGNDVATRIADLCTKVKPEEIAHLAVTARNEWKLRHIPLFLCVQLLKLKAGVIAGKTIELVVKRPDEMSELITLYRKDKRIPLAAQLKKGLARVYPTFNAHQLGKWNKDATIKLRDVMFMVHPKPKDAEQAAVWKQLVDGTLASPDTWEVALSAGQDKKATWERLLTEQKLGDMALLMNLRNMQQAGVNRQLIIHRLKTWSPQSVVLPFRFVSAAKAAPDFEDALSTAIASALSQVPRLQGRTLFVIDVSGSMQARMSEKSDTDRIDAACSLAMMIREICDDVAIYATGGNDRHCIHATTKIPPRHGFALRDAIQMAKGKLGGGGIFCYQALQYIQQQEREPFDRVLILTDEVDCDTNPAKRLANAPLLGKQNYLFNVGSYRPGLELGGTWKRINGWSERVIDWIQIHERVNK